MKHIYYLFFTLLLTSGVKAQNDLLKEIFPSAPSSNNLMKFEEVPISYYTGIPNISIPLFNSKTKANDFNLTLSYHPNNSKPKERASEVGLGWSLNYGGVITRAVRGVPDEGVFTSGSGSKVSIGIYFDEYTNRFSDKNFASKFIKIRETTNNFSGYENEYAKFLYEAYYFNRFDTQYDLYQYNFMGQSGRFIVKKDSNNKFYVEKLDVDNLKIVCNFDPNTFSPLSFDIIDDNGITYRFDVIESTDMSYFTSTTGADGSVDSNGSSGTNVSSAFHLSKILKNNIPVVLYNYSAPKLISYSESTNLSRTAHHTISYDVLNRVGSLLPAKNESKSTNFTIQTRLIDDIEIIGQGKIQFNYIQGREDTHYGVANQMYKLNTIAIHDSSNNLLNKYVFNYDYFSFSINNINHKRLRLNKIDYHDREKKINDYKFTYHTPYNCNGLDKWGWLNKPKNSRDLSVNEECVIGNQIKTIKLPTGGIQYFDFGSNTYSYLHDGKVVPELYEDKYVNLGNIGFSNSERNKIVPFLNLDSDSEVEFNINAGELYGIPWQISLYKDGVFNNSIGNPAGDLDYKNYHKYNLEKGNYTAEFRFYQMGFTMTGYIGVQLMTYKKVLNEKRYINGGGIRINSIKYFDSETEYLRGNHNRSISYNYNDSINDNRSSGTLVFPEPINSYTYQYNNDFLFPFGAGYQIVPYSNVYDVFSLDNFIPLQKTKGGDIGYNQITIKEVNGNESHITKMIYTSPKESPNPNHPSINPPFKPINNFDYKRGVVLSEIKGNSINGIKNNYINNFISENLKITGLNIYFSGDPYTAYLYSSHFDTYEKYKLFCDNGGVAHQFCYQGAGSPIRFLHDEVMEEVIGIPSLKKKNMIEFFSGNKITTDVNYEYSNNNPLLISKQTTNNSKGEDITTEYQYPSDLVNNPSYSALNKGFMNRLVSENRISEPVITQQKVGTISTSEVHNQYNDFNGILQKSAVHQKKGKDINIDTIVDRKIKYDSYDDKGNLTQYTLENGIPVSIIWGYNGQYPILKVEGVKLVDIPQWLIDYIKHPSDWGANNTELSVRLNYQRNEPYFKDAMVTGYVYKPLVGVTEIIQPNGQTEFYEYDSANRLKSIKNSQGEVLKTFEYHYKP